MLMGDGKKRLIWTTFSSGQIDIDVSSKKGQAYLLSILKCFADSGIGSIRLDAAGYVIKKKGSNCFMIPETFSFLDEFSQTAKSYGVEVLVEIHSYYRDQIEIAEKVDRVYDFALPALVLQSFYTGNAGSLANWLKIAPRNAVTVLDTHDGIGIVDVGAHPDGRPGLLTEAEIDQLIETVHRRTNGQSREAMANAPADRHPYQVYSTYYDALGKRDTEYLIARALQFFCPGIPQVYYIGLLCALNDMDLYRATRSGRDVNRRFLARSEIDRALENPTVKALFGLIRFRNTYPAFNGSFSCDQPSKSELVLSWKQAEACATLTVDFASASAMLRYTEGGVEHSKRVDQFG
jgi:sucrose phosphorylase